MFSALYVGFHAATAASGPEHLGRDIAATMCRTPVDNVADDLGQMPAVVTVERGPLQAGDRVIGQTWQFILSGGRRMTLQRIAPREKLRGVRAELTDTQGRPEFFFAFDHGCALRLARALRYGQGGYALELVHLDASLRSNGAREPVNPPVPPGVHQDGVRVALVDSGVNYLLPDILSALARGADGRLIGYDFWDLDDRPFDAHNPRSAFVIQRHGTRTAALVVKEAPLARIVPYRYPRPAMERMRDLVLHAARHEIRIAAIPMGSNRAAEWRAFAEAAAAHPGILFIASAGNNGRNIDRYPVYPAALDLDNLITVTSADDYARPADRVNWGPVAVDLLVPAERRITLDFDGSNRQVSGSSYAVSRIAALAARLLAENPALSTAALKTAIFRRARDAGLRDYVRVGYLPDPLADTARIIRGSAVTLSDRGPAAGDVNLKLDLAVLEGSGWVRDEVQSMVRSTADILVQCGISLVRATLHPLHTPPYLMDFHAGTADTLIKAAKLANPAVFLVRGTAMEIGFDGEAFGRANTATRPWLRDTVWLAADTSDTGIALAHELFHVLTDSGEHSADEGNLMRESTHAAHTALSESQCRRARETGLRHGLLSSTAHTRK